MKNLNFKLSLLAIVLLAVSGATSYAEASEVQGTMSTGLGNNSVSGIVLAAPTASPVAGTYTSAQSVSLTSAGSLNVRYTTDGTTPTCTTGTVYATSIAIPSTQTVKAISCYANSVSSSVASYTYTINIPSSSGSGGGKGTPKACAAGFVLVNNVCKAAALPVVTTNPTVSGASFTFVRDLTLGSTGEDVTALQKRLTSEGVYSGPITGFFGPMTLTAVQAYQTKVGLPSTGFVGPLTKAKLNVSLTVAVTPTTIEALQAQLALLMQQLADLLKASKTTTQ